MNFNWSRCDLVTRLVSCVGEMFLASKRKWWLRGWEMWLDWVSNVTAGVGCGEACDQLVTTLARCPQTLHIVSIAAYHLPSQGSVLMAVMTGKLIYAVTRHSGPASFLVWLQSTIIHHISLITSDPHIWRYSFLKRGAHVKTLCAGRVESRDPSLNCQVLLLRPQLTTD